MKKQLRNLYSVLVPMSFRMDKNYWKIKRFLNESQFWNKNKIVSWQLNKLREIVKYAYNNVTGYKILYDDAKVKPEDINNLNDIKNLPFVTKEMLSENLKDFTSRTISYQSLSYVTTSGSTGIPFGFYQTKLNGNIEDAFIHQNWEGVGWKLGKKAAVLKGRFVGSIENFCEYYHETRELLLSSYYLTEHTYDRYIKKILEYKPLYLKAYPSMATILADLIIQKGDIGKINFEIILLGSENIYQWQKQRILKAFPQAKIFGWYGQTEKVILAVMCKYSDEFHIMPFYGYTEILNENEIETKQGELGELVGTSFWNLSTPFIRYRTMDMARKGSFGCELCNRQFQLLTDIEGRTQDTLISRNGRRIPVPSTSIHSDIFDKIKQFQFYQNSPGKVILKIVRKDTCTDIDTNKIKIEVMKKLGHDMELQMKFVDMIPRTSSGKYRFLEQKLKIY